ncbi:hypothetical protein JOD82_001863 [Paenibacillus sp. 1182]|nr:hypothetical protein [Paenibacillus sp. 1182]MBP1308843.1 hypothetical protein [Paenibacillus sp. 1182]
MKEGTEVYFRATKYPYNLTEEQLTDAFDLRRMKIRKFSSRFKTNTH